MSRFQEFQAKRAQQQKVHKLLKSDDFELL
jgi:hypothetical protein